MGCKDEEKGGKRSTESITQRPRAEAYETIMSFCISLEVAALSLVLRLSEPTVARESWRGQEALPLPR